MILSILAESALRSLLLGGVVWRTPAMPGPSGASLGFVSCRRRARSWRGECGLERNGEFGSVTW
jgi:hypothetical protein